MSKIRTQNRSFKVLLIVLAFFLTAARTLPEELAVEDLSESYYNHRIVVMGWVSKVDLIRGIRGGQYFKLTVTDGNSSVIVFSDFKVFNIRGERVIVQGYYKRPGRFAGFLTGPYISSEYVERDWDWTWKERSE